MWYKSSGVRSSPLFYLRQNLINHVKGKLLLLSEADNLLGAKFFPDTVQSFCQRSWTETHKSKTAHRETRKSSHLSLVSVEGQICLYSVTDSV